MSNAQIGFRNRVILPIAMVVGTLILLILVVILGLSQRQTDQALAQQRALAKGIVGVRLDEIRSVSNDYSYWDDAYRNLVTAPNRAWAEATVGATMNDRFGVDMAFVVDPQGVTTFGNINGVTTQRRVEEVLSGGYHGLLRQRARAGPSESQSGVILANGEPALVSISPLRPFRGEDTQTVNARHVLIFVDILDQEQLTRLAAIYHLPNLSLSLDGGDDGSSIDFKTADGMHPFWLVWSAPDPGRQMLAEVLPLIGILLAMIVALTVLILRQAASSARKLEASEKRALFDSLTGLKNRAALLADLERHSARTSKGYSLLYSDLDGFKQVNDTHGHGVGDEVLRQAGKRLQTALQPGASAYRLGGDEFAIVLPGTTDTNTARAEALALIAAISEPIVVNGIDIAIGATIGVATTPDGNADVLDLLRKADIALYSGKRDVRGTVRFYVDLVEAPGSVNLLG